MHPAIVIGGFNLLQSSKNNTHLHTRTGTEHRENAEAIAPSPTQAAPGAPTRGHAAVSKKRERCAAFRDARHGWGYMPAALSGAGGGV